MQDTSSTGTQFWDDKAKAAQIQKAADRHRVLLHSAFVLALIAFAIIVSSLLAGLGS
ncbi:MAG: hypothetical protein IT163_09960 [Bryobacterales bacterium]|nr:hypothetical protein [Bryobacterales bacterium]